MSRPLALALLTVVVVGCSVTQPQETFGTDLLLTASRSSYAVGEPIRGELLNNSGETIYLFQTGGYTHVEKRVGAEWTDVKSQLARRYYRWDSLAPGARQTYEIDRERLASMVEVVPGTYRFEAVVVSDHGVSPFGSPQPDGVQSVTSAPFKVAE